MKTLGGVGVEFAFDVAFVGSAVFVSMFKLNGKIMWGNGGNRMNYYVDCVLCQFL